MQMLCKFSRYAMKNTFKFTSKQLYIQLKNFTNSKTTSAEDGSMNIKTSRMNFFNVN